MLAKKELLFLITRIRAQPVRFVLDGYEESRSTRGQPTILCRTGGKVKGVIVRHPTDTYLERLDSYYGPNYQREVLEAKIEGIQDQIQAYLLKFGGPCTKEGAIDSPLLLRVLRTGLICRKIR